jgi:hypothetical protein
VRDDVVQLRSDSGPFVAHGERGVGLPFLLQLPGAVGELVLDELALAQRPPRAPYRGGEYQRRRERVGAELVDLERCDEREQAAD